MKKLLLSLFILTSQVSLSQNQLVKQWDHLYGGTDQEVITSFIQARDGGYLLGGYSKSTISGDKTETTRGDWDFWIVKTDALGIKEWDKDFGGTSVDEVFSLEQTSDGGFIIGGRSNSDAGGDKTQPVWGNTFFDYWILKIDSLGNKTWDKDFGGTGDDYLCSVQQTNDGGFIIGGFSNSGISGDKTQGLWGAASDIDYWVVKTDASGNKEWDKDFGGTDLDYLLTLQQTTDKGFVLGGYSFSGISGDKTQSTWGGIDYWLVKTDSLGNKQWDKDFGATNDDLLYSLQQTSDGGYILGGYSYSGSSGDKTEPLWGTTGTDLWMVKTDALGNKQWDKSFGGTDWEELWKISQTTDHGYLLSGDSYSPISGNKNENNLGYEQTWMVKTDSLGILQWDKTVLTPGHDEVGLALQSDDGCYAVANFTYTGSAAGGYRTQASWSNSADYWIVKFCDTTQVPQALFNAPHHICPGTCTDFINLSINATSYQWTFAGATPSTSTDENPTGICYNTPGTYSASLIATGMFGSDTLILNNFITVYPYPAPQGIQQSGDTLFANAGASGYQWYFNGSIIPGATGFFYVAPASGDYNVVATDANGCEVEAAIFNVVASVNAIADQELLIFPNPVTDQLVINRRHPDSYREAINTISIYNTLGELVWAINLSPCVGINCTLPTFPIDVSQLPPGIYYLELTNGSKIFRNKFLKSSDIAH